MPQMQRELYMSVLRKLLYISRHTRFATKWTASTTLRALLNTLAAIATQAGDFAPAGAAQVAYIKAHLHLSVLLEKVKGTTVAEVVSSLVSQGVQIDRLYPT